MYDRQIGRWMPHITLLYPFWPAERFDEAAGLLGRACSGIDPFGLTLDRLSRFKHGRGRYTMWFDPEPHVKLVGLQAALQAAFPECDDVSRFPQGFTPHLSVGQARGRTQLTQRMARIVDTWRRVQFEVSEIVLISRDEDGPFDVDRTLPLGPRA